MADTPFIYRSIIKVSGEPCGGPAPTPAPTPVPTPAGDTWVCSVCDHVYDAEQDGAGAAFEDLPDDWKCPVCFQPKSVYEKKSPAPPPAPAADTWVCSICAHVYDAEQDGAGVAFE